MRVNSPLEEILVNYLMLAEVNAAQNQQTDCMLCQYVTLEPVR